MRRKELEMSARTLHLVDNETNAPRIPKAKETKIRAKKGAIDTAARLPRENSGEKASKKPSGVAASLKTHPGKAETPRVAPKKRSSAKATKSRTIVAAQIMRTPAVTCRRHDSLNEAVRLMWENDHGVIVVVNDRGEPVGMITDRDACMAAYTQGVPLICAQVDSAMSKNLVTCSVATPTSELRQIMADAQVRRLPVLDTEGKLVGIIGLSDVLAEALKAGPSEKKQGNGEIPCVQLMNSLLEATTVALSGRTESTAFHRNS